MLQKKKSDSVKSNLAALIMMCQFVEMRGGNQEGREKQQEIQKRGVGGAGGEDRERGDQGRDRET